MTTIDEARNLVLNHVTTKQSETISCLRSTGRILAEDVTADVDSPPHRKSLVDGFAVRTADLPDLADGLAVIEEIYAGQVPVRTVKVGEASRIMTGAPLPQGADAVAMVEDTSIENEGNCEIVSVRSELIPGQNIQERGAIMSEGEVVLSRGHRIRPIEIGLLSEVGRTSVMVSERPLVSILPTGDELVDPGTKPAPGMIRNTNGPMLTALVDSVGAISNPLGIGRDDTTQLRAAIEAGLQSDVLVLSGGVSMGRKDYVPSVLNERGVQSVFHRVQLRPGKPIWFGVSDDADRKTLVFGLPGNPVSSYVCFCLFVKPAIDALQGYKTSFRHGIARLAKDVTVNGNRPTYFPAKYTGESDELELLAWKGSADQHTMCEADCLAFFPEPGSYRASTTVLTLSLAN